MDKGIALGKVRRWLAAVPVHDPVDRRNAPFMQVLLLCMGCLWPLNKLAYLCFAGFGDAFTAFVLSLDALTDTAMTAVAWLSLVLIRRGHFRRAVRLFIGVMLAVALLAYGMAGLDRLSSDPFPLLLLGLAGLMLGRRALWVVMGVLAALFAVGALADALRQLPSGAVDWAWGRKLPLALSYLMVVVVLDRTIAVLRESLDESRLRGRALARANRHLAREMAERERAQGQLLHAQKMEAVGRIASGVAHDFDNVLSVVLGYARRRERLADQGVPALLAALEGVELAGRRALAVSRRLLDFARQDSLHPEVFDAAQALEDTRPMLRQLFGADTRLEVAVAARGRLPVHMDRGQFELMLLNIAANARDAMPAGGRFAVTLRRDADALELVLADDGCGMPEGVRRRVFEPFYTTKAAGSGTGLGLAVVHELVLSAHGNLGVDSLPGQGTSVRIRLPLAEAVGPIRAIESCLDAAA